MLLLILKGHFRIAVKKLEFSRLNFLSTHIRFLYPERGQKQTFLPPPPP